MSKLAKYLGHNQIETLADHDESNVDFFNVDGGGKRGESQADISQRRINVYGMEGMVCGGAR
jgi:hypothetical protein